MKAKAYVNGVEVVIYDYADGKAKCFVPELGVTSWYRLNQIEVTFD